MAAQDKVPSKVSTINMLCSDLDLTNLQLRRQIVQNLKSSEILNTFPKTVRLVISTPTNMFGDNTSPWQPKHKPGKTPDEGELQQVREAEKELCYQLEIARTKQRIAQMQAEIEVINSSPQVQLQELREQIQEIKEMLVKSNEASKVMNNWLAKVLTGKEENLPTKIINLLE